VALRVDLEEIHVRHALPPQLVVERRHLHVRRERLAAVMNGRDDLAI